MKKFSMFVLGVASLALISVALVLGRDLLLPNRHSNASSIQVAAGDVDQSSVVLWAHSLTTGTVTLVISRDTVPEERQFAASVTDVTLPITVTVGDLLPATAYRYRAEAESGETVSGYFRTAAPVTQFSGLRFGVSGDWRASLSPFVALRNVPERQLDFFVALGDTIYADIASVAVPKAQAVTLADFRAKHYEIYSTHLGPNPLRELRASTAYFATLDDHEVTNDFAGGALAKLDKRFHTQSGRINQSDLFKNGLQAFLEYHPLRHESYGMVGGDGRMDGAIKLYRYRTFGRDAALFLLDTRSFRDLPVRSAERSDPVDVDRFRSDTFRPGRTLLGLQQLADLKRDLQDAQRQGILWKFVLVPEPIQHRGLMSAQDRFEGYALERTDLLRFIEEVSIENVVFIAADIHGTLVNNLSYATTPTSAQIPLASFEITTGPAAFYATLGQVVIQDGVKRGIVSAQEQTRYESLPVAPDPDTIANDRDDFVKALLDQELIVSGYDPIGLDNSTIQATLLRGDYVALHTFGWSEFAIDPTTHKLKITTYGIDAYSEADLRNTPVEVGQRQPQIVSQFEVLPE